MSSNAATDATVIMEQSFDKIQADYKTKTMGAIKPIATEDNGDPEYLKYFEIGQDYKSLPELADVGCICNSEPTNFDFEIQRFWDNDTMAMNIQNANKMINDLEWTEQSKLHNATDNLQIKPGMVVLSKSADGYSNSVRDVNFFQDIKSSANSVTPKFNSFGTNAASNTSTAIEIFGYFHPDVTGIWGFDIPSSDNKNKFAYLWIGDTALYDYTADNAIIHPKTRAEGNRASINMRMSKGDYVPIRMQFVSKNVGYNNSKEFPLQVYHPDKTIGLITENPVTAAKKVLTSQGTQTTMAAIANPWQYFVTFVQGNDIYYKNLLYFGLVQSETDPNKYNCYFVNTKVGSNAAKIREYKTNPRVQYVKTVIPLPTTFKGDETYVQNQSNRTNIVYPTGVKITVTKATYGIGDEIYNYKNIVYKNVVEPKQKEPTVYKTTVSDTDPNLGRNNNILIGTGSYVFNETVSKETKEDVNVKQYKDVTSIVQQIVASQGGNKLVIDPSQYDSFFGNPISDPKDPNISIPKNLLIQYTYLAEPKDIRGLYLKLNSKNAKLQVGFTFGDTNQAVLNTVNLDDVATCSSGSCTNYTLSLGKDDTDTNSKKIYLMIKDGNAVKGRLDLTQFIPDFKIADCLVNQDWLTNNDSSKSNLNADTPLDQSNNGRLFSSDGRFKIAFENGNFVLTYCVRPYTYGNVNQIIRRKDGNNGTVSCDTFCKGGQWAGWGGTCLSAINNEKQNGKNYTCTQVPSSLLGGALTNISCDCDVSMPDAQKLDAGNTQGGIIKYTTTKNVSVSGNVQIYYLYRIYTRGLYGRKFLQEINTDTGATTMHYLPNSYDNILIKPTYSTVSNNAYPLFKDGALADSDIINSNKYIKLTNLATANDCEARCVGDCQHYFFARNDKNNTSMCYIDAKSDANPMFTSTNPDTSAYTGSILKKKGYTIKSTCGKINPERPLYPMPYDKINMLNLSGVAVDYKPNQNYTDKTYYCGLPDYIKDNATHHKAALTKAPGNTGTYTSRFVDEKSGFTTMNSGLGYKEYMTNYREGYDNATADTLPNVIETKLPDLNKNMKYYGNLQDYIGTQYDDTLRRLQIYSDLSNNMASQDYKFNSTDSIIPDQFINNPNPRPTISLVDGRKRDVGVMLMQQNTMYTLASITAATCLILGVAFAGAGGGGE